MRYYFLFFFVFPFMISCNQADHNKATANDEGQLTLKETASKKPSQHLPFIGKRDFETRPGVSGTGTPRRSIEIRENGDVYFSFIQINQAERDEIIEETYYAGRFQPFLKCVFKKWDNETNYYEITKDKIYQVDSNHNRLTSEDCCNMNNFDMGDKCPCEGELYDLSE